MASITITRGLNQQGGDMEHPLVSAFTQNSIEFEFDKGSALTGTYATVTINYVPFRAVLKTPNISTNTDLYILDLTNTLSSYMGLAPMGIPPYGYPASLLTKDLVMTINGYNSSNVSIATATHETIQLCFGVPTLQNADGMDVIFERGIDMYRTVYHNTPYISFFWGSASGTYTFAIGSITHSYSLTYGYNYLYLDAVHQINGTLTCSGHGLSIPLIYKSQTYSFGEEEIEWINKEGSWSLWNFRALGSNSVVTKGKTIPIFAERNYDMHAKTIDLQSTEKIQYSFDTIAVDIYHYSQLCEISKSPRIIYNNRVCRVIQANTQSNYLKQNLHFSLTLEIEENAVSY
jgi:hypothetical protein